MTQLRAFRDAVLALVTTDATFVAQIQALIGVPATTALTSNIRLSEIPVGSLPCWGFEWSDGHVASLTNTEDMYQTIGLSMQSNVSECYLFLVWQDNNRDAAANARADLPYYLTQLFLRNPQPGGCEAATFIGWKPDKAVNHPTQVFCATLRSTHSFPQSG